MRNNFTTITEIPGGGATFEQLSMALTRYHLVSTFGLNKDVLEVACGSGFGLGYISKNAKSVIGGDIDPKLVKIATQSCESNTKVIHMSAENLPFDDNTFDVVALLEAVYYLTDVEIFLKEAYRVLKTNGILIVCFPNIEWKNFNSSPFSKKYYKALDFNEILIKNSFEGKILYGFRHETNSKISKLIDFIRSIAVKLKIIPKSFFWKDKIKKIFFGKLIPIPKTITDNHGTIEPLISVENENEAKNYRVVYSIGKKII